MSTPTQDAFDQFEKRSTNLAAYRTVVQTVAGPADLDIYVRATERFCGSDRREDAWRIWLGVAERARQLGRADIERDANEHAVAAAPDHAHVLVFLADAIASGRARAAALRRCGESGERETVDRAQSFTDAAKAFADNGDEDEAVECWEGLAALDAEHALAAARGLNAFVQKLGSPSVLAARAGALLMRADGDIAEDLWTLSQSTAGLVDDAIVLDWVVRVVHDKPEWTQTVLHWSRGVRGASPRNPEWRALHRTWSESVGDVETQHQALTEEAGIKSGGDRAAILLRRAALEYEKMREPSRALATASEALAADDGADVVTLLTRLADDATCGHAAATLLCSVAEQRGDTGAALVGQRVLSTVDDSDAAQLTLARRLHAAGETAEQMAVLARLVRRTPGASSLVAALLEAAEAIPAWPEAADALCGSSASAWPANSRSQCLQALLNAERWPALFRAALTLGATDSVADEVLREQRSAAFGVLDAHSEANAERALWLSRLAAAFGANDPDLWPHILDLAPSQASLLSSLPDAVAAAREAGDEARIERVLELRAGAEALQLESDLLELARKRGDTATADRWAEAILTEEPGHALASSYASSRWEAAPGIAERLLALGIDTLDPQPRALRHAELASQLAPALDGALRHWLAAASIEEQSEASRMSAWRAALELATNSVDAEALAALAGQRGLPGSAAAALDERLDELWAFGEGELVEQLVVAAASAFADTQFQDRLAVSAYREGRWQDAVDAWNALELDPESDRASLLLAARLRATDAGSAPELVDDVLALLGRMPAAPDVVEAARELPDHALIAERFVAECATAHPESVAHWETAAALGAGTEHQVRAWLGWLAADPSAAHPAACIEDEGDDEAKRSALRLRLVSAGEAEGVALRLALAELEADDDAREGIAARCSSARSRRHLCASSARADL